MDTFKINTTCSFKISKVKFTVDADSSFLGSSYFKDAAEQDGITRQHYHAKTELFFVFDDPMIIYEGGNRHEFRNSVVVVPAFHNHYSVRGADYRVLVSYEIRENDHSAFSRFVSDSFSGGGVRTIAETSKDHRVYLNEFFRAVSHLGEISEEMASSAMRLLIYRAYLDATVNDEKLSEKKDSYLLIIERIINSTARDADIDIGFIANELHLSKKQTSRIIKKFFKKPLSAVIREKKLNLAAELLHTTSLSVAEISSAVNFRSENYFYLEFKKMYGTTPLKYRKQHRTN